MIITHPSPGGFCFAEERENVANGEKQDASGKPTGFLSKSALDQHCKNHGSPVKATGSEEH